MTSTVYEEHMTLLDQLDILTQLENMDNVERLRFVSAVSTVFCLHCGADQAPNSVCACLIDE